MAKEGSVADIGKASHGGYRRSGSATDRDDRFEQSQLMSLLSDASGYDVLVSADRAINRLGELTDRKGLKRRIVTIVDVIDHLLSRGRIAPERWADAARLIEDLADAGDPFSSLAAFRIASARANCPECVERGTAILSSMLGATERLDAMAHDFAAIARSVIAFADIYGSGCHSRQLSVGA